MSKEEESAFIAAVRKAKSVQEIHAAFNLLPDPPSGSTTGPPTTSEDMWLAILDERTANDRAI